MNYSCKVKFGAINNLTDARYAAAAYADWVGFCFDEKNARYIHPLKAKEIMDWLAGPQFVAELGEMPLSDARDILELLGIDAVQIRLGTHAAAYFENEYQVLLDITGIHNHAAGFFPEGTILLSNAAAEDAQMIDITDLPEEEIIALAKNPPMAININGGDEAQPGIRDFDEVTEILALFENEEI